MGCCDWSIGQCLQTSNKALTMLFTYGFRKFICNVKVLTFKRKILKCNFEINFQCERGYKSISEVHYTVSQYTSLNP